MSTRKGSGIIGKREGGKKEKLHAKIWYREDDSGKRKKDHRR